MFISVEGVDFSGKTTLCESLRDEFERRGYDVLLTREPGGSKLGEEVREIFLKSPGISPMAALLMINAGRVEHIERVIKPALCDGKIVICDRFLDSTLVYQGDLMGISKDLILQMHSLACDDFLPDKTILIDIDKKTFLDRYRSSIRSSVRGDNWLDKSVVEKFEIMSSGFVTLASSTKRIVKTPVDYDISGILDLLQPLLNIR